VANQFTKGTRKKHDEATKDKIRAEHLARRMYKFARAKGDKRLELDMTQSQVAAARVLIERGKPALQAVEQTILNPIDAMSEDEIRESVRSLITLHPWLLEEFRPGPKAPDAEQQSTATSLDKVA
jgi:hypothetical protein